MCALPSCRLDLSSLLVVSLTALSTAAQQSGPTALTLGEKHGGPNTQVTEEPGEYRYDLLQGTTLWREAAEWGLAASLYLTNELVLSDLEPWPSHPLLGTAYQYWSEGESREPHVPYLAVQVTGGALGATLLLLPNNRGWLNHVSYRHAKGLVESFLVMTPLLTELAKLSVGRERPDYDQRLQEGELLDADERKSFWSGHSSAAFSIAVYTDWFIINNVATNDAVHLSWKIPVVTTSLALATYVAYTRVLDHRHDGYDVVAGSAVGAGVSTLLYGLHQNWFGGFYHDREPGKGPVAMMSRTLIVPQPHGVSVLHRF